MEGSNTIYKSERIKIDNDYSNIIINYQAIKRLLSFYEESIKVPLNVINNKRKQNKYPAQKKNLFSIKYSNLTNEKEILYIYPSVSNLRYISNGKLILDDINSICIFDCGALERLIKKTNVYSSDSMNYIYIIDHFIYYNSEDDNSIVLIDVDNSEFLYHFSINNNKLFLLPLQNERKILSFIDNENLRVLQFDEKINYLKEIDSLDIYPRKPLILKNNLIRYNKNYDEDRNRFCIFDLKSKKINYIYEDSVFCYETLFYGMHHKRKMLFKYIFSSFCIYI